MDTITAKRQLGEGRWDKALKRKMTELSVSDNYDEAKHEWIATGEVWWAGNDEMPDWVANSQMGAGKCLCGHIVVYHFQIENTENGRIECVGSDHINTYLIMRAIAEDLKVDVNAITDEQIQQWIDVRTKSMKAEAWWKSNGTGFELMFDAVKEIDLHNNVHYTGDWVYDSEIKLNVENTRIRKRAEGKFGSDNYKMASIVWRWNHPDNPKAQINTTGFPNDNLMKDLSLMYVLKEKYLTALANKREKRAKRIAFLEEKRLEKEANMLRIRLEREAKEAEQLRVYNLPENVEKRRLAEIEERKKQAELRIKRELLQQKRIEEARQRTIAKQIQENETLRDNNSEFENLCGYYGVPVFDESFAKSEWERTFLSDIKEKMLKDKPMSDRQLSTLRNILETKDGATDKQTRYLKSLGYKGNTTRLSKREASELIQELLD